MHLVADGGSPGTPSPTGDSLHVIAGPDAGVEIPIEGEVVLGRAAPEPGSLLHDPELSRLHARVVRAPDRGLVLEDLDSTNGTYLNGWRIPAPQIPSPGDRVQVGAVGRSDSGPPRERSREVLR